MWISSLSLEILQPSIWHLSRSFKLELVQALLLTIFTLIHSSKCTDIIVEWSMNSCIFDFNRLCCRINLRWSYRNRSWYSISFRNITEVRKFSSIARVVMLRCARWVKCLDLDILPDGIHYDFMLVLVSHNTLSPKLLFSRLDLGCLSGLSIVLSL